MRSRLLGLAAALILSSFGSTARAQNGGFSDPFFLYYGWYLPRQSAMAAQPQPEDFYRAQGSQRAYQAQAASDRTGLYDPAGGIGMEELDPLRPFGTRSGNTRMVRTVARGLPTTVSRSGHAAPASHFRRTGSYYPSMRSGQSTGNTNRQSPVMTPTSGMGAMGVMGQMGGLR